MKQFLSSITINEQFWKRLTISLIAGLALLTLAQPASAHHPFGGETPSNLWEGFLSGLGHPVIGMDHLAFVVGSGLAAASSKRGWIIPVSFVLTAMAGTGMHLQGVNLPVLELVIGASVLTVGVLLAVGNTANEQLYSIIIALGSAIAGIFHGYAYGEAIIGAEMTPLVAYLAGFSVIQLAIALSSYKLAQTLLTQFSTPSVPLPRLIGCGIMGMGLIFVTSAV
ncbi:MAG: urease accessory protein UreJ [Cyanobacteria bacterium SW_9_44_58]|nr:MAG: urease accessory protein UreJ [Cyanobacteria bacterium SW_9_44_58]